MTLLTAAANVDLVMDFKIDFKTIPVEESISLLFPVCTPMRFEFDHCKLGALFVDDVRSLVPTMNFSDSLVGKNVKGRSEKTMLIP